MGIDFSVYDVSTGRIVSALTAYSEDERDAQVPAGHAWIEGLHDPREFYVSQSGVREYPPKLIEYLTFDYSAEQWVDARGSADLEVNRAKAMLAINTWVAAKRRMIVTDLPGQDMIYLRKEEEGLRYLSLPVEPETLSGFPLIAAEVGITAPTAYQVATIWVQLGAMWVVIAAQLEQVRLSFGAQIQSASTFAEIDALIEMIEAMP